MLFIPSRALETWKNNAGKQKIYFVILWDQIKRFEGP